MRSVLGKVNMYRNTLLKNTKNESKLDLSYKIPNFKLPLKINTKLLKELTKDMVDFDKTSYYSN